MTIGVAARSRAVGNMIDTASRSPFARPGHPGPRVRRIFQFRHCIHVRRNRRARRGAKQLQRQRWNDPAPGCGAPAPSEPDTSGSAGEAMREGVPWATTTRPARAVPRHDDGDGASTLQHPGIGVNEAPCRHDGERHLSDLRAARRVRVCAGALEPSKAAGRADTVRGPSESFRGSRTPAGPP